MTDVALTLDWVESPLVPHAAGCAVRFDPAGKTGDWADVVALGGGRLAVVVGDAMGWGAAAAPLAATLSRAARLLLSSGADPSHVVGELDSLVGTLADVIATVACAVIDPRAGRVELASAGHPPPLVIPRGGGGPARLLPCRPGPPLGFDGGQAVPSSTWTLPPSVLFFYTDGLIDGRGRHVEEELARLAESASCPDGDLHELCRRIIAAHVPSPPEDDVTVLAVPVG